LYPWGRLQGRSCDQGWEEAESRYSDLSPVRKEKKNLQPIDKGLRKAGQTSTKARKAAGLGRKFGL